MFCHITGLKQHRNCSIFDLKMGEFCSYFAWALHGCLSILETLKLSRFWSFALCFKTIKKIIDVYFKSRVDYFTYLEGKDCTNVILYLQYLWRMHISIYPTFVENNISMSVKVNKFTYFMFSIYPHTHWQHRSTYGLVGTRKWITNKPETSCSTEYNRIVYNVYWNTYIYAWRLTINVCGRAHRGLRFSCFLA